MVKHYGIHLLHIQNDTEAGPFDTFRMIIEGDNSNKRKVIPLKICQN